MSSTEGPERRRHPRLPVRCRVAYRTIREGTAAPKAHASETINLSASGLCLRASGPLASDQHVALEIELEDHPEPVVAIGRVVWCDRIRDGEDYRVGLCFTWLRDKDRRDLQRIADYVEARTREGGSD